MKTTNDGERDPVADFYRWARRSARKQLPSTIPAKERDAAADRLAMTFMAACRGARDPAAFMDCAIDSPASVAACVNASWETGLYPGATNAPCYLVPQRPRRGEPLQLQWRINHRGVAILANKAGFHVRAVPVSIGDHLVVSYGEVVEHQADPEAWPTELSDILGLIVVVRRLVDGLVITRTWCPRGVVERRHKLAKTQMVWGSWPIEMAQKTAIKWAYNRGEIPMDSPEIQRALEADNIDHTEDVLDDPDAVLDEPVESMTSARSALGMAPQEIEDKGEPIDELDGIDERPERVAQEAPKTEKKAPKPRKRASSSKEMP